MRIGIALLVEEHLARRRRRRGLAIVDGDVALPALALAEADDHVAAATDIAGAGISHRHRETGGDRGVDGIAAPLQDREANAGGARLLRDHHAVTGFDRALGAGGGRPCGQGDDQEGKDEAEHHVLSKVARIMACASPGNKEQAREIRASHARSEATENGPEIVAWSDRPRVAPRRPRAEPIRVLAFRESGRILSAPPGE